MRTNQDPDGVRLPPTASARRRGAVGRRGRIPPVAADDAVRLPSPPQQRTPVFQRRSSTQSSVPAADPVHEEEGFPGGPVDTSLLYEYGSHIAKLIWEGKEKEIHDFRLFSHGKHLRNLVICDEVMQLIEASGLKTLLSCAHHSIDKGLVGAFIERWHQETSSFHLPIGEMSITLDDVSSLLHIPVDGALFSVTIVDRDEGVAAMEELLGCDTGHAHSILLSGLLIPFSELLDIYQDRCQEQRYDEAARALLLCLVGTTLFTNRSSRGVHVYYLELFRDLEQCRQYAWGVGALTHLYDSLTECSRNMVSGMCGFLTLMQAWIFEHFPTIVPEVAMMNMEYDLHLGRAARLKYKRKVDVPYRARLDALTEEQVTWMPYESDRAHMPFQDVSLYRGWIRWGPLMYRHLPDRVLRQFGYIQGIPSSPRDITSVATSPAEMNAMFLAYATRLVDLPDRRTVSGGETVLGYLEWFRTVSHPWVDPASLMFTITKDQQTLVLDWMHMLIDERYVPDTEVANEMVKIMGGTPRDDTEASTSANTSEMRVYERRKRRQH